MPQMQDRHYAGHRNASTYSVASWCVLPTNLKPESVIYLSPNPVSQQGTAIAMPIPKQKPLFLLVLISFESCVLVENLLLTALFILTFDFSLLRQLIKIGRFLHKSFFSTLVDWTFCNGNFVQPTLPCCVVDPDYSSGVVPTAGSLSIMG